MYVTDSGARVVNAVTHIGQNRVCCAAPVL